MREQVTNCQVVVEVRVRIGAKILLPRLKSIVPEGATPDCSMKPARNQTSRGFFCQIVLLGSAPVVLNSDSGRMCECLCLLSFLLSPPLSKGPSAASDRTRLKLLPPGLLGLRGLQADLAAVTE